MTFQNFKFNIFLVAGILVSLMANSQPIYAPISKEYFIHSSNVSIDVQNTGTDYAMYNGCLIQVSVWDGSEPGFGWRAGGGISGSGGASGSLIFEDLTLSCGSFRLTDPDVVLGVYHEQLIAKVVGIDPDNFVRTINFNWDNMTNKFIVDANCPCRYGAAWPSASGAPASGLTKGRKCSYPNIDANADGDVAITWTETETYMVEVTLGFPFPITTTPYFMELKRGNVLGAYGTLDNVCLRCSSNGVRRVFYWDGSSGGTDPFAIFPFSTFNSLPGFPVIADPAGSFDPFTEREFPLGWFNSSDVAISESKAGKSYLSFVFYDYRYDGSGNPLHVTQFLGANDCPEWIQDWNSFYDYPKGTPRIAAPSSDNAGINDFHVVLGYSGSMFDCETQTTTFQSNIGVLGVYGGTEMLSGATVNILTSPDLTDRINMNPVISYRLPESAENREVLVVSWTSTGIDNTDRGEIIAAQYRPSNATPIGNGYSIVNELLTGNQGIPSVAARRDRDVAAYNWADLSAPIIEIKQSNLKPGSEVLRGEIICEAYPRPANANEQGVILYPNPANQSFVVLPQTKSETMYLTGCVVYNALGKAIPVSFNSETKEVKFKNKPIPGVYQVKLQGKTGTFNTSLQINP